MLAILPSLKISLNFFSFVSSLIQSLSRIVFFVQEVSKIVTLSYSVDLFINLLAQKFHEEIAKGNMRREHKIKQCLLSDCRIKLYLSRKIVVCNAMRVYWLNFCITLVFICIS